MRKRHYIKNGKGLQGVYIDSEDLRVLKFIWTQRMVTTNQIIEYYQALKKLSSHGIRNKLRRWSEYHVVDMNKFLYRRQFGISFNYFKIGDFGFEILMEEGLIQENQLTFDYKRFPKTIKNMDHFFATQAIVTRVHCFLINTPFVSIFPTRQSLFDTTFQRQTIVPDWVLSNDNSIINIETDSGSEKLHTIDNKIKNYEIMAEREPSKNIHILFSVMDDSLSFLPYSDNREKRVASLKAIMVKRPYLRKKNLYIHVVPLSSSAILAAKILRGDSPLLPAKRQEIVEDNMNFVWNTIFDDFHFKITACDDDIYPSNLENIYFADKCVWFQDKVNKERRFRVLVVVMEEGSLKALDRLDRLDQFKNGPNQFKCQVEFIMAMYRTEKELQRDVIGRKFEKVLFGSEEGWFEQESETPIFYFTKSSF